MNTKKSSILLAIIAGITVGGWIVVQLILHRNYEAKPKVFNALGLNPTVYWRQKLAPDFKLKELDTNKIIQLSQFRGKPVLLEFWASWCHSCKKQLRVLQTLHNDPSFRQRVQILSINMKETISPQSIARYVKQQGYSFPVLLGTEDVVKTYKIWFFPTMVLVSPTGIVAYTGADFHSESGVRKLVTTHIPPHTTKPY